MTGRTPVVAVVRHDYLWICALGGFQTTKEVALLSDLVLMDLLLLSLLCPRIVREVLPKYDPGEEATSRTLPKPEKDVLSLRFEFKYLNSSLKRYWTLTARTQRQVQTFNRLRCVRPLSMRCEMCLLALMLRFLSRDGPAEVLVVGAFFCGF